MKKFFAVAAIALLTGCAAEGELDGADMGVTTPDASVNENVDPNSTTPNTGTDAGTGNNNSDAGTTICDPLAPACPAGQKCVPNTSSGQSTCIPTGTENEIGETCQRSSECVEGAACINDDGATLCRELCDPEEITSCTTGTFCTKTLGSDSTIGVCADAPESCDIYSQDCASNDCVLLRNPADGEIGAYCGDAGSVSVGQPCGNGAGDCVAGAICVQAGTDTQPTCHAVCRTPDAPCTTGACTGSSAAGVDFCV